MSTIYEFDLFLSYSSKDKRKIRNLHSKLVKLGYKIWLDEQQIQVGEKVLGKISEGLSRSRLVAIWLSKFSVASNWVEVEWQSKYSEGIQEGISTILPLKGQDCEIPYILKGLKYADFSKNFKSGFVELISTLSVFTRESIEGLSDNLNKGINAEFSAKRLAEIVLSRNIDSALEALWGSITYSKYLFKIIDHCAWSIGKIVIESKSVSIRDKALNYIYMSIESEIELVIEKFAYTAYRIHELTEDEKIKEDILGFINKNLSSENDFLKNIYQYVKVKHWGTE